jgi:hypothetical protein
MADGQKQHKWMINLSILKVLCKLNDGAGAVSEAPHQPMRVLPLLTCL